MTIRYLLRVHWAELFYVVMVIVTAVLALAFWGSAW